jgi:hypothetical protein
MAPCIIDFIGALLGPVGGREPWTVDTPGPLNGIEQSDAMHRAIRIIVQ